MKILKADEKGTSIWRKFNLIFYTIMLSFLGSLTWWVFTHGTDYIARGYAEWAEQKKFRNEILQREDHHAKLDSENDALKRKVDELQDKYISELDSKQSGMSDDIGTIIKTSVTQQQTIGLLSSQIQSCCSSKFHNP